MKHAVWLLCLLLCPLLAAAVPSLVEPVADGVWAVRDDNGVWGGMTNGITHMNRSPYQARKILDLSDVPEATWAKVKEVRLSAYFMVHDYSWHDLPQTNGLDEAYEVIVNGTAHRYATNSGAPVYLPRSAPNMQWYDFRLAKDEFRRGPNEIIVHKAEGAKGDDYLYLGIDNTVRRGNSSVNFDGQAWTQDKLTIPGGNGEYMIRLYLIAAETAFKVDWRPGAQPELTDPAKVVLYAGCHDGRSGAEGLLIPAGGAARVEWHPQLLDRLQPVNATVELSGAAKLAWLDAADKPFAAGEAKGGGNLSLDAGRTVDASGLIVTAGAAPVTLTRVTVSAHRSFHPLPAVIDLAPAIAELPPMEPPRPPRCTLQPTSAELTNDRLRGRFTRGERLQLASLYNEYAKVEMVRDPAASALFTVTAGGQRYAGSRDFRCESWKPAKDGFAARLTLAEPALAADLWARIDTEGLRLGLKLTNTGRQPVDFQVNFPHLAGIAVSDRPADDYYYFPWGGGIIADRPVIARRGYGDHEALYQLLDVYGPARGAGLYVRADDDQGWHKIIALRKHVPGAVEENAEVLWSTTRVKEQYRAQNSLEAVEGTGMEIEYLRRTRPPGESFAPAPAVIAAHPGDWHVALRAYADWAHRVWKFRPYPSRLKSIRNMMAAGWGKGILFRDGAYRTDIIADLSKWQTTVGAARTKTDCVELMSWWEWSDKGPWNTPFDKLDTVLPEVVVKRWEPYFVTDPVTGKKMWNNQPGDYRGYNERFGGLPAFRQAIDNYRKMGALVTLYTDPFRLDESSETGRLHGKAWSVVGADDKKSTGYEVWNPCHDLLEVREWVAAEMGRVMRETGADGIRLDEYGHRGWACYDPTHRHTYAEVGLTQWQKATADATRRVHEAMDKVRPDLVLTTEHPGYDYLMQYLEGCITYDLTGQASTLRPLECNTQRFYFRECKPYELDHRNADPGDQKKFWNAVESFGRYFPPAYYAVLSDNEDTYWMGEAEPLVRTPGAAKQVYVNRFRGDGKTIHHLYNATGHTFDGVALAVDLKAGEHLYDPLGNRELAAVKRADGRGHDVTVYLPRADVACVLQLTRRLAIRREGAKLTVEVKRPAGQHDLVVATANGDEVLRVPARDGANVVDLTTLPEGAVGACVKLMSGRRMVDLAAIP